MGKCLDDIDLDFYWLMTPKLRYYKPDEVDPYLVEIARLLDPRAFLRDMVKMGELDEISDNYRKDVFMLCEYSVAWAFIQLQHYPELLDKVSAVTGSFMRPGFFHVRGDHSWLLYQSESNGYYIDLTLAQFIPDAPQLAITDAEDQERTFDTWDVQPAREYIEWLRSHNPDFAKELK